MLEASRSHGAKYGGLGIAAEGHLQDPRQLRVSEVDELPVGRKYQTVRQMDEGDPSHAC